MTFSRPIQVALAAAGLLLVVWFFALRPHSSSSESPSAPPPVAAAKPSSHASGGAGSSGSPGSVYHGSAPGVEGLTRAIAKARGAHAEAQHNANQLEAKASQASSGGDEASASASTRTTGGTSAAAATQSASSHTSSASTRTPATKAPSHTTSSTAASGVGRMPAGQVWVEHQIKQGAFVALLFYNAKGADDVRTRTELEHLLSAEHHGAVSGESRELGNPSVIPEPSHGEERLVLRVAPANEVGAYGSFTRVAAVYETPTLLVITPKGQIKPALTGLTDAFSMEQALDEQTQR